MNRAVGVILLTVVPAAFCQQSSPTFEVASIKPSNPNAPGSFMQPTAGGGFRANGVTLQMLIRQAYGVQDYQIFGATGWMESDRFDVNARSETSGGAAEPASPDPPKMTDAERRSSQEVLRLRLQDMLAGRFQLKAHPEKKEVTVFALTAGKSGPKLMPPSDDARRQGLNVGMGQITGTNAPIDSLIRVLSNQLGRPVEDRTNLKGRFDFKLTWSPDPGQLQAIRANVPPGVELPPPPDPDGPTLVTALQEQLGLRLNSIKGFADAIVIDHAEKPSEN